MKKILRIFLYSLLGLLLVLFAGIHIIYHTFSPDDKEITVDKSNLGFYHASYEECRQTFRDEAKILMSQYEQAELFSIHVPSPTDKDLTIDLFYLPPLQQTDKLLVLSSGVHGVEGYTGSAVQQMFLKELVTKDVLADMGVLIIHGVNPFGFKYLRRQTENNVDLNRGSEIDPSLFTVKNQGYGKLNDMLNPEGKVSTNSLTNQFFYVTAISKILKTSMSATRQAIVQGQYEYPEGLFFGGFDFEPQIDSLRKVLPVYLAPYSTILEIDLHTAYGSRGVLHLFPNAVSDPELKKKTELVFKGHQIDWGDSDNFYTVSGGFADTFMSKLTPHAQYLYMVFEWGTYDTETTFGSIKSLQIMINENQGYHYGYKNNVQEKKIKKSISEMEYPSSEAWRSETMNTGREMLSLVLKTYPEID
ncbi:M14 family metallopeptidase [Bacteroidota bacterium]